MRVRGFRSDCLRLLRSNVGGSPEAVPGHQAGIWMPVVSDDSVFPLIKVVSNLPLCWESDTDLSLMRQRIPARPIAFSDRARRTYW
jgi:hypothetical protein